MIEFTAEYKKLDADFRKRNIPTDKPGFCDHPNFLKAEKLEPNSLNNYAAYVATQPYSTGYLQHAHNIITRASRILYKELETNGRLGACVDISAIFSQILDKEGIWNCGIKGSLTITFPPDSNEEKTYFWSIDHGEFEAGHAWLSAPPFSIVDVAVKQQPYNGTKRDYLPNFVLSESTSKVNVEIDDIISPSVREKLSISGLPEDSYIDRIAPQIKDIIKVFPALNFDSVNGAILKYCPVAIHASNTPLKEMHNMNFSGKTPFELYNDLFKGKL